MNRLFSVLYRILIWILVLICGGLFVFGLFRTVIFRQYSEYDLPDFHSLNPFLTFLIFAALLIVIKWLLDRLGAFEGARTPRRLRCGGILPEKWLWIAFLFAAALCGFLLFVIRGLPTNDAKMLYEIAQAFLAGNYDSINNGYLAYYPFQLSYVMINEWVIRLFGEGVYLPFQLLNILSILLSLFFLYETAWELTEDVRVPVALCVLSFGCWMLYAHATFIYNDIISLAPLYCSLYFLVLYLKRGHLAFGLLAAMTACLSCVLKTNGAVAVVAMGGLLFVKLLRETAARRGRSAMETILVLALTILASFAGGKAVNHYYERVGGYQVRSGVPAMAYFAMGLTENGNGLYGWYNGDNVRYLSEAGLDSDKAAAAAGKVFMEKLSFYVTHPKSGLKFFGVKFLSQWADPTKGSLRNMELTGRHQEGMRPKLAESMTFGTGFQVMQQVMHYFHLFLYFFGCIGLVSYLRKKHPIGDHQILLPLFVFGGMLFHELWEASGRYTLRYELALLPFAAQGLVYMLSRSVKPVGSGVWRKK